MWKLAVWESSTLSPVIYAEDMFDQCTVCLVKVHLAHPHVLFSSHLCGNLSAYLTRPSFISVSTFKFKGTGAAESPHCARFVSSIPILMSGSLDNQWCVWPSPQYSGTLTFLCVHIHEWVQVYMHYGTPWRSEDNLNCRASLQPMWSRDCLPHPHHRVCQERWPVNYSGFCIHCQSPHRNAGIADALAACLSFTWALGTLTLSPTKPSPPPVLYLTFSRHLRNAAGWFSVSMFSGLKHTDLFLKFFNASHSNPGHWNMSKAVFPTHSDFHVCILICFPCDNRTYSFPIWRVLSLMKAGEKTETEEHLVGIIVH